jgi:hypothetical protein
MKTANIRQNDGDRKGFHIFRHRLLTGLLANDVAQPVISSIAGHTSPKSLESYLSADFKHLKECAISVDSYPVSSEVCVFAQHPASHSHDIRPAGRTVSGQGIA